VVFFVIALAFARRSRSQAALRFRSLRRRDARRLRRRQLGIDHLIYLDDVLQ
jgi:hypothetical protein